MEPKVNVIRGGQRFNRGKMGRIYNGHVMFKHDTKYFKPQRKSCNIARDSRNARVSFSRSCPKVRMATNVKDRAVNVWSGQSFNENHGVERDNTCRAAG